jgi:vacuolar-type H+-ATPase subunit F/Vma7
MSRAVAIGARTLVGGYALAGVEVVEADEPKSVLAAWERLGDDVALLILTPDARRILAGELEAWPELVWTTLPE